jgi:two-component system, NtrC family, response regulator PilR
MSQAPYSSASLSPPAHILVVDDEPDLRTLYELTLLREGYRVSAAGSLGEAQALIDSYRFDLVITDMKLPDGQGLVLLLRLQQQRREERCVVMTAYGSAENAVEALKAGAFDYLTKPVDLKQFRTVVSSAIRSVGAGQPPMRALACVRDPAAGEAGAGPQQHSLSLLVGYSPLMVALRERVAKVARSMAPVLVRGESGTGKELAARALHANSHRSEGPFVAVNCGAIPENLLEAEFFGVCKGAYTGASQDRDGYFQAARNGTLFLDEIGDLPLAMQVKLLRAIQERRVRPIGATQEDPVNVRIVSATHRDLAAAVQEGTFRQDLYYRLNVIEIAMPSLRERRDDLPELCQALLQRIADETGQAIPTLTPQGYARLGQYDWPGNVRELENLLQRALALGDGQALSMEGLLPSRSEPMVPAAVPESAEPQRMERSSELPSDLQAHLDGIERKLLVQALRECEHNRTAAAQRLGLSLRQMRYRIERLHIAFPAEANTDESID